MADTAVRPRPNFSTFLRSDASAGGDALTYYRRKQHLRKNKTALLQAKAGNLPNIQKPSPPQKKPATLEVKGESVLPKVPLVHSPELATVEAEQPTAITTEDQREEPVVEAIGHQFQSLTTRPGMSSVGGQPRLVKSASAHGRRSSWSVGDVPALHIPRPRTVGPCSHDRRGTEPLPSLTEPLTQEPVIPQQPPKKLGWLSDSGSSDVKVRDEHKKHKRAYTEPAMGKGHSSIEEDSRLSLTGVDSMTNVNEIKPDDIEALARAYIYGTSTQRSYDEVGWHNKLPSPLPPPSTAVEPLADQVSLRFTMKRYDAEPADWQAIGTIWDYTQTRKNSFHKGPQAISFCSPSKRNQQIPRYSGHISDPMGEVDDQNVEYKPMVVVRTIQPWHTKISRTANIPGYAGCVHWSSRRPAHDNMPKPEPASTARVHR